MSDMEFIHDPLLDEVNDKLEPLGISVTLMRSKQGTLVIDTFVVMIKKTDTNTFEFVSDIRVTQYSPAGFGVEFRTDLNWRQLGFNSFLCAVVFAYYCAQTEHEDTVLFAIVVNWISAYTLTKVYATTPESFVEVYDAESQDVRNVSVDEWKTMIRQMKEKKQPISESFIGGELYMPVKDNCKRATEAVRNLQQFIQRVSTELKQRNAQMTKEQVGDKTMQLLCKAAATI